MQSRRQVLLSAVGLSTLGLSRMAKAHSPRRVRVTEIARSILHSPRYVALGLGFVSDEGLEIELSASHGGGVADIALAGPEVPICINRGESSEKIKTVSALVGADGPFLASREPLEKFDWKLPKDASILAWRPASTPELYFEYVSACLSTSRNGRLRRRRAA